MEPPRAAEPRGVEFDPSEASPAAGDAAGARVWARSGSTPVEARAAAWRRLTSREAAREGARPGALGIYPRPGRAPYLLVGEAPNRAGDGPWILRPDDSGVPHSANRLLELSGLSREAYDALFDRTNLLRDCPPRRHFPLGLARVRARELIYGPDWTDGGFPYLGLVILGRRAAGAFWWWGIGRVDRVSSAHVEPFRTLAVTPHGESGGRCPSAVMVPHPSGLNRWWNDAANVARAREWFGGLEEELGRCGE